MLKEEASRVPGGEIQAQRKDRECGKLRVLLSSLQIHVLAACVCLKTLLEYQPWCMAVIFALMTSCTWELCNRRIQNAVIMGPGLVSHYLCGKGRITLALKGSWGGDYIFLVFNADH